MVSTSARPAAALSFRRMIYQAGSLDGFEAMRVAGAFMEMQGILRGLLSLNQCIGDDEYRQAETRSKDTAIADTNRPTDHTEIAAGIISYAFFLCISVCSVGNLFSAAEIPAPPLCQARITPPAAFSPSSPGHYSAPAPRTSLPAHMRPHCETAPGI